MGWLSLIADIASILSLLVSLIVWRSVARIQKGYAFAARVPEIRRRLAEQASMLASRLRQFESSTEEVQVIVGLMQATLGALERNSDAHARSSARRALQAVRGYNAKTSGKDAAWRIYAEAMRVIEETEHALEDFRWRR